MVGEYYRRKLFDPESKDPYALSRTRIELFIECPRCFYLSERCGISRPRTPPFTLNNTVDELMKKEFDIHRARGKPHPLMSHYHIKAVPLAHDKLDEWRDALRRGVRAHHVPTNLIVRGGIDDVWINDDGELHVVDYKATSKNEDMSEVNQLYDQYRRQVEIYQWLFKQNGFKVSRVAYFVYVNADKDRKAFDGRLDFKVSIIAYEGDNGWVDATLKKVKDCLMLEKMPQASKKCEYCVYRAEAERVAKNVVTPRSDVVVRSRAMIHNQQDDKKNKNKEEVPASLF